MLRRVRSGAGADALLVLTEWPEFRDLDLGRIRRTMHKPVLIDGRNLFVPDEMAELGFTYSARGPWRPPGSRAR